MLRNRKPVKPGGLVVLLLVLINVIAISEGYTASEKWYRVLFVSLPFLLLAILNTWRRQRAVTKTSGRP